MGTVKAWKTARGTTPPSNLMGVDSSAKPVSGDLVVRASDGEIEYQVTTPGSASDIQKAIYGVCAGNLDDGILNNPGYTAASGTNLATASFGGVGAGMAAESKNEKQTITMTGTPTGGNFTITFDGVTSGNVAYNATAANVKTALVAMSNFTADDVETTGGPFPGTAVVIEFKGAYRGVDVAEMTTTDALSGGTSPATAVTVTQTARSFIPENQANIIHLNADDAFVIERADGTAVNIGTAYGITRSSAGNYVLDATDSQAVLRVVGFYEPDIRAGKAVPAVWVRVVNTQAE